MGSYRIYHVTTFRVKSGKGGEAAKWWAEKGEANWKSLPGVKSVRAFANQWAIGGPSTIEIWVELENYATYDAWDAAFEGDPSKYGPFLRELRELLEQGPARIMGDWPESGLTGSTPPKEK